MHVYGDAYIYGQLSIFPASNSAFIFNDLVRASTADQFTRSCNMAILIFSGGGADFKLYGRGNFPVNMLYSKLSFYLTTAKKFISTFFYLQCHNKDILRYFAIFTLSV